MITKAVLLLVRDRSKVVLCNSKVDWRCELQIHIPVAEKYQPSFPGCVTSFSFGTHRTAFEKKKALGVLPLPNLLMCSLTPSFCHCWHELRAWVESSRGGRCRDLGCNGAKMCVNRGWRGAAKMLKEAAASTYGIQLCGLVFGRGTGDVWELLGRCCVTLAMEELERLGL